MPALGATGALSARTVSLARRRYRPSCVIVAPEGMNPRMLCGRKKVKVRISDERRQRTGRHEDAAPPERPKPCHGEGHREDRREDGGVPRPSPQHTVEAQGCTGDGDRHREGHQPRLRAGLPRGLRRPGIRTGGARAACPGRPGRAGVRAGASLRCQCHRRTPDSAPHIGGGGQRRGHAVVEGRPRRGQRRRGGHGHGPPAAEPEGSEHLIGIPGPLRDHQGERVCAQSRRPGTAPGPRPA